ncbi:MAG TPA: tetratricopeptide repeat protein [Anaeromyxobacter sp.]|nr:tetratricopeptide repeat protein [Anaeromyxobacter sp.]
MSRLVLDRLWPMLLGLALLLAGALALEGYAARRGNAPIRIAISDGAGGIGDEEEGPAPAAAESPPVSETHARARRAARRAQLDVAVPLYEKALAERPGAAALEAELGALLLADGAPERALPHLERADALAASPWTALRLGIARGRLDDDAGAERELRRALALRPGFGDAQIALGTLLRRRGDVAGAVALLEPAAQAGSNEDRARALVALGAAYLAAGRRADAAAAFDRAVLFAPARAEVRLGVARAWLSSDAAEDVQRAVAVLARATEMAPDVPPVWATLGRARERAGDLPGAAEAYDRALRLDPSYRYARRRMIRLSLQTRDVTRARREAERLVADAPQVPEHHFLAALAADRDGRDDEARRAYRKAIEVARGDYPEAYLNLGNLEKGAGNRAAAQASYEKAIAIRPGYGAAWLNLGKLHEAAGDAAKAEAAYGKALEIDPGYASAWLARGQLRSQQGRTLDAIEDLKRAAAARKGYDAAELSLGVAYRRAGRVEEAIAAYRALLERSPRYVSAWYNLALSLVAAGRPGEARAALARASELDPDHVPTRVARAELDLAEGNVAAARAGIAEALELAPADVDARATLAAVLAAEGDRRGCEERARQLRAEAPEDPSVQALGVRCAAARPVVRATKTEAP